MTYKQTQIRNLIIILILMGLSVAALAEPKREKVKRNYCAQYYEFAIKMRTEKKRYEYKVAKRMANACTSALKQGGMKGIDERIGTILELHQKNDAELRSKAKSVPNELKGDRYRNQ